MAMFDDLVANKSEPSPGGGMFGDLVQPSPELTQPTIEQSTAQPVQPVQPQLSPADQEGTELLPTIDDPTPQRVAAPAVRPESVVEPVAYKGFFNELGRSFKRGSLGVGAGIAGTIQSAQDFLDQGKFGGTFEDLAESLREKQKGVTQTQGGSKVKKFVANAVGEALPFMAATVGATLVGGPGAGMGVAFSVEGDNAYRDALESGASEEDAQIDRMIVGSINAALEKLQVDKLLGGSASSGQIIKNIVNGARKKAWKEVAKAGGKLSVETLKTSVTEGLQEALQETVSVMAPAVRGGDLPEFGEAAKRIGSAGLGGAVAGGILGGGGGIIESLGSQQADAEGFRSVELETPEAAAEAVQEISQQAKEAGAEVEIKLFGNKTSVKEVGEVDDGARQAADKFEAEVAKETAPGSATTPETETSPTIEPEVAEVATQPDVESPAKIEIQEDKLTAPLTDRQLKLQKSIDKIKKMLTKKVSPKNRAAMEKLLAKREAEFEASREVAKPSAETTPVQATEVEKVEDIVKGDIPVYVRVSKGPEVDLIDPDYKSENFKMGGQEDGMSAWAVSGEESGKAFDDLPADHPANIGAPLAEMAESTIEGNKSWLLTGEFVGTGQDGEPLIRNAKHLKTLEMDEVEFYVMSWVREYAKRIDDPGFVGTWQGKFDSVKPKPKPKPTAKKAPTVEKDTKPVSGEMAGSGVLDDAHDSVRKRIRKQFIAEKSIMFEKDGKPKAILKPSSREGVKFEVSYFSEDGKPFGHHEFNDLNEAIDSFVEESGGVQRFRLDLPDEIGFGVETGTEFVYESKQRPVSLGTTPKDGFLRAEKGGEFGMAIFDRPLTESEIERYGLEPIGFNKPKLTAVKPKLTAKKTPAPAPKTKITTAPTTNKKKISSKLVVEKKPAPKKKVSNDTKPAVKPAPFVATKAREIKLKTANTQKELKESVKDLTSARQADIEEELEMLGLDGPASKSRKKQQTSLENAIAKGIPERASRIASEVNETKRSLDDEETAGLVFAATKLKNEYKKKIADLKDVTDDADIAFKSAEANRIEEDFGNIFRAIHVAGSQAGRDLVAHKLTLNDTFDLVTVRTLAKAAKKANLSEAEAKQFDQITEKLDQAMTKIDTLQKEMAEMSAKNFVVKGGVKRYSKMTSKQRNNQIETLTVNIREMLKEGC